MSSRIWYRVVTCCWAWLVSNHLLWKRKWRVKSDSKRVPDAGNSMMKPFSFCPMHNHFTCDLHSSLLEDFHFVPWVIATYGFNGIWGKSVYNIYIVITTDWPRWLSMLHYGFFFSYIVFDSQRRIKECLICCIHLPFFQQGLRIWQVIADLTHWMTILYSISYVRSHLIFLLTGNAHSMTVIL